MKTGICRLCGTTAVLQSSHVIPSFVFRWLKETSGTGHLRFAQEPNKRVQDGPKYEMLCRACEERFNEWETEFSVRVFHPMTQGRTSTVRYGDWMAKFCVSVSWRVLVWYQELGH